MKIAMDEADRDLAELGAVKRDECTDILTERKDRDFMLVGSSCK